MRQNFPTGDQQPTHPTLLQNLGTTIAVGFAAAAILKDIRNATDHHLIHGELAGGLPYDFRRPTLRRIIDRAWNPAAPLLTPSIFGLGWTLNLGAVAAALCDGE